MQLDQCAFAVSCFYSEGQLKLARLKAFEHFINRKLDECGLGHAALLSKRAEPFPCLVIEIYGEWRSPPLRP
jgi:hypothetical protein